MSKKNLDVLLSKSKLSFYFICQREYPDSFDRTFQCCSTYADAHDDFLNAFELFRETIKSSRNLLYVEFGGKLNKTKRVDIVNFIFQYLGKYYKLNWIKNK